VSAALNDPDVRAAFAKHGVEPEPGSPAIATNGDRAALASPPPLAEKGQGGGMHDD
jgi:hypothetical protein